MDVRYTKMMSEFDEGSYDELYSRNHNAFSVQVGVALSPRAWPEPPTAEDDGRTSRSVDCHR